MEQRIIDLNGNWLMHAESLFCTFTDFQKSSAGTVGWLTTPVPGDIREGLISAGQLKEPLSGLNSEQGHWVEQKSWWLKQTFSIDPELLNSDMIELELNGLDCKAMIFLNDRKIGEHPSAFRPFIKMINEYLVSGENTLIIRLTDGLHDINETQPDEVGGEIQTEALNGRLERGDRRRIYVRKPQFAWGWDWAPRVPTIGITGDCRIRIAKGICIRDVQAVPSIKGPDADVAVTITVESFDMFKSGTGVANIEFIDDEGHIAAVRQKNIFLQSGINFIDFNVPLKNVKLWWPAGMGNQSRYTINAIVHTDSEHQDAHAFKFGIRSINLDTQDSFGISVNGKYIFCKGANWVPPDAVYGRIRRKKIEQLVQEAVEANFNMFRIWGGGLYERDAFYDACDRYGIMLWHDFMFCCSPYPDHLPAFVDEIEKEADYQTKRLRTHASVVLWCGSNECIFTQLPGTPQETLRGSVILGKVLPEIVRRNCPSTPYWYSSPYGCGNNCTHQDHPHIGDCHFWASGVMNPDPAMRISTDQYDNAQAKFISEYGFPGPCSQLTTLEYLDGAPMDMSHDVWKHHLNTFEQNIITAAIRKRYGKAEHLAMHEYLTLGGLVQGLVCGYSLESFRSKPHCRGALLWMYNDAWGEIGWSIIDYYLRRKVAWYFVKRAFAHKKLILRNRNNEIACTLANDSPDTISGILEYGYMSLDGKIETKFWKDISIAPLSRKNVASFEKGSYDETRGVWFAKLIDNQQIMPAILYLVDFCQLKYTPPMLHNKFVLSSKNKYDLEISTTGFAHAINISLPNGALPDDNYFDLLPNHTHTVHINSEKPLSINEVVIQPYGYKS